MAAKPPRLITVIAFLALALAFVLALWHFGGETELLIGSKATVGDIPLPPKKYRSDGGVQVTFAKPELVQELCGRHHVVELIGCASPPPLRQMVVPNPCAYSKEIYARIICHENGHVEGWSRNHSTL